MYSKTLLAGAAVALMTLGGAGIAHADDDADGITGQDAERAKDAALAHTNGGRVTDSEVGDDEGYYEVEVTRDDGTQTDVHLDRDFNVIGSHPDDSPGHGNEPGDDDGLNDDDGPGDDDGFLDD